MAFNTNKLRILPDFDLADDLVSGGINDGHAAVFTGGHDQ